MNTPQNELPSSLEEWIDAKDVDDLCAKFENYTGPSGAGICFNRDLTNPQDRWDFDSTELRSTFDA